MALFKEATMKKHAMVVAVLVVASLWMVASAAAGAAGYPAKGRMITIIVPSTAGGGTDTATRMLAPILEKDLGVPIQIVNKPGASMQIGLSEVAAAKPDGYTLVMSVLPTAASIYLDPERKATFTRKNLQPIALVYEAPFCVWVLASSPYKTLKDVADAAKANPDKIKSGTTGYMSTGHFANIEFQRAAGVKMATVNFQGGGPAITALLGGHIDVAFNSIGELLGHNKAGTIRILGVMDDQESEFLPGIKTLKAQGYSAQPIGSDIGVSSPAGLPKEIADLLTNAVKKAMGDETFKKKMAEQGNTVRYLSPQDYAAHWDRVDARFKVLIDIAKQQPQ
jgi:tripartite-type tricarboxylate transporter receptor subunit TctC